ncbi:MotE family protein [Ponticaulis profundi]|uniref:MotE family protein n=1 Tax=Ponticaulis profundi TaxID=2665222 RepID=A0ABW1S531_9PROT
MNTKIRLLPVIAVVAFGAFAVKAVSIAEAAGEAAAKSGQEQTAQAASTASQKPESGEVQLASAEPNAAPAEGEPSKPGDACPAPDLLAEQAGLSPYEIQVLRNLAERREELDARAEQLDTREMTISAAELRLNDQIDELKSLEGSIQNLLDQLDVKNDEQVDRLVKTYESMKPKDAARIFNTMDDQLMLSIADNMKPAAIAAILSSMSSERAQVLTFLMAQRTEPPETISDLEARTSGP